MDMTRPKGPERKLIKITPQMYQRLIKHGRYKDNMNKVVTRVLDWVDKYVPDTEKQVNLSFINNRFLVMPKSMKTLFTNHL